MTARPVLKKQALFKILLILLSVNIASCKSDSIDGKKLYVLSLTAKDLPMLQESELNFIEPDKVEMKTTVLGYAGEYKTFKSDPSIYVESRIFNYVYKNGILEVPDLSLTVKLNNDGEGNFHTNTNETFYKKSIVDILGTNEAQKRVKEASTDGFTFGIFSAMLEKLPNGNVKPKNEHKNANTASQQSDIALDTVRKETTTHPNNSEIAAVNKANDSLLKANGIKPDLTLSEMLEFVKRDHFTQPEIEKYLARICTLKMKVESEGSKIDFSGNDNEMEYDPYKYTFTINYSFDDQYQEIIKQLNKSSYRKSKLNPASDEISNVIYQNKTYLINCIKHYGGSMGNSPCTIIISRAPTFIAGVK
jgi:hypothetical protein